MAYDHHGAACLKEALGRAGTLPNPFTPKGREKYLRMEDWFLFEHIRSSSSRDAQAILQHKHDRKVRETSEVANEKELRDHEKAMKKLQKKGIHAWASDASKSWYKSGSSEILIAATASHAAFARGKPLTEVSETAGRIRDSKQRRIYVPFEMKSEAADLLGSKGDSNGSA
jgi:hypothetical protein